MCLWYLSQVQVVLLHINQMVPDEQLHGLHIVLVLIPALDQTPKQPKRSHWGRFEFEASERNPFKVGLGRLF